MSTPRPLHFSRRRNSIPCLRFPNSHRIISFADPHLLNPFLPYRYKNHEGVTSFRSNAFLSAPSSTPGRSIQTCKLCNLSMRSIPLSPLRIPRRMHILSDHRESKGSSLSPSRFSPDPTCSLSPAESALADKHRVLPVFSRTRHTLSLLDATLARMPIRATIY
jgi:hypothetical protein